MKWKTVKKFLEPDDKKILMYSLLLSVVLALFVSFVVPPPPVTRLIQITISFAVGSYLYTCLFFWNYKLGLIAIVLGMVLIVTLSRGVIQLS